MKNVILILVISIVCSCSGRKKAIIPSGMTLDSKTFDKAEVVSIDIVKNKKIIIKRKS
jgi:hypothetical protein